eukprot:PhM_4_TR1880/c0_g1_i1/m.94083
MSSQKALAEGERHNREVVRAQIVTAFHQIDTAHTGKITKAQFETYLKRYPTGWPLGDLLQKLDGDHQKSVVQFWFRKIDVENQGYINQDHFIAFFQAMSRTEYQESILTDFLLNLFDDDLDGRMNQKEYVNMLTVMLGKAPSPQLVKQVMRVADKNGDGKLDREELRQLLHRVHCDLTKLTGGSGSVAEALVVVAGVVAAVAVGTFVFFKYIRRSD